MKVDLTKISTDPSTQARITISSTTVDEYAEALAAGTHLPPVVLFGDDNSYWIGDGFHRVHAARKASMSTIEADVRPGGHREALLHAAGANASHGLRRTNGDKRRAVLLLLADPEWSKESDRWIAKAANVSHTYVAKLRPRTGNVASTRMEELAAGSHEFAKQLDTLAEDYEILGKLVGDPMLPEMFAIAAELEAKGDLSHADIEQTMHDARIDPAAFEAALEKHPVFWSTAVKAIEATKDKPVPIDENFRSVEYAKAEIERHGGSAADVDLLIPPDGHQRWIEWNDEHRYVQVYVLPSKYPGYYFFAYIDGERGEGGGADCTSTRKPTTPHALSLSWLLSVPLGVRRILHSSGEVRDFPSEPVESNPYWSGEPWPWRPTKAFEADVAAHGTYKPTAIEAEPVE